MSDPYREDRATLVARLRKAEETIRRMENAKAARTSIAKWLPAALLVASIDSLLYLMGAAFAADHKDGFQWHYFAEWHPYVAIVVACLTVATLSVVYMIARAGSDE